MVPTLPVAPLAPVLPTPTLPVAGTPAPTAAPVSAAPDIPVAHIPAASPTKTTNWKPIQRSKARKALNGAIGIAACAAIVGGAWFAYQSLAPSEDTTTPTTLLIDNPDTFVGQANAVVNEINEQAPDQELLDLAGVESPTTTTP